MTVQNHLYFSIQDLLPTSPYFSSPLELSLPPSNSALDGPIPRNRSQEAKQQKEIALKAFTNMVTTDKAPHRITEKFLKESITPEVNQACSTALHTYFTAPLSEHYLKGKLSADHLLDFITSRAQYDLNDPQIIATVGDEKFSNFIKQSLLDFCLEAFPEIKNELKSASKRDFVSMLEALRELCLEQAQDFIQKSKCQGLIETVSGEHLCSVYEPVIEGEENPTRRRPIEDPYKLLPEAPSQLPINSITALKYITSPKTGALMEGTNPFSGKKITRIQYAYHLMLVFYRLESTIYTKLIEYIRNERNLKTLVATAPEFNNIDYATSFNVLKEIFLALKKEAEAKGHDIITHCQTAYINGDFLPHIVEKEFIKRAKLLTNNDIKEKENILLEIYKGFAQKMEDTYKGYFLDQENLPIWKGFQNTAQQDAAFQSLKKKHIGLIKT